MRPELRRVGAGAWPVVVIDDFGGNAQAVIDIAATLAPFPRAANYYPGLRRIIRRDDAAADAYVVATLERAAPFIAGAFDADRFDLVEASFSIVTDPAVGLSPPQRAPHFDSTDPDYLALLHYLGGTEATGTGFYRQISTGIEVVTEQNLPAFVAAARRESASLSGYTNGSNAWFEQIAAIEAVPDRLIIYPGRMLHSGLIPADAPLDSDPRRGRLTANFFVQLRRG
jgi:hypothetical protein